MSPFWTVRTARLLLAPVAGADLPDLIRLKADARVFAIMLGGVRTPARTVAELAEDIACWGAHGWGIWTIRGLGSGGLGSGGLGSGGLGYGSLGDGGFVGITGFMHRPDGRGVALRFALWPEAQGQGLAREAAGAALRYGHERAGLTRIVAVARASNFASRMVLGGIGMTETATFEQGGHPMVMFESRRAQECRDGA